MELLNEYKETFIVTTIIKMKNLFFIILIFCITSSCKQTESNEIQNNVISIGIKEKIFSKILDEEREVWVHVPEGFYGMNEQEIKYPVVYLVDGEIHFKSVVGLIDEFSSAANANDLCPQMIIVGITNTNRNRDLTPTQAIIGRDSSTIENTGGAKKLADFIEQELIPFIDNKYPTSQHRTLIGHSFGGLFVLNTLLSHPDLFANYLAIDPSMWWDNQKYSNHVIKEISTNNFKNQSLYIAIANNMMPWMDLSSVEKDTTEVINQMRSLLNFVNSLEEIEMNNLTMQSRYYKNEYHGQVFLLATYDALKSFYSDYPFSKMIEYYYPGSAQSKKDITLELENHYEKISKELGYKVLPMESYVNAYAFGLLSFDKPDIASNLFDLNLKNYPKSANVHAAKGYYFLSKKDTLQAIKNFRNSIEIKELPHVAETLREITGEIK